MEIWLFGLNPSLANGIGDDIAQITHMLGSQTAQLSYGYDPNHPHQVTSFDTLLNGGEDTLRPTAAASATASYDTSNRPLLAAVVVGAAPFCE